MWQDNRIQAAIDGTNPMVMAELPGGFAVFGDVQFYPVTVCSFQNRILPISIISKSQQELYSYKAWLS